MALRDDGHEQMMLDQQPERMQVRSIDLDALADTRRRWHRCARGCRGRPVCRCRATTTRDTGAPGVPPAERARCRCCRAIPLASQIRSSCSRQTRVCSSAAHLMIKLMLHRAGELAELRDILAEKIHPLHRPQDRGDVPALVEDGRNVSATWVSRRNLRGPQGRSGCG